MAETMKEYHLVYLLEVASSADLDDFHLKYLLKEGFEKPIKIGMNERKSKNAPSKYCAVFYRKPFELAGPREGEQIPAIKDVFEREPLTLHFKIYEWDLYVTGVHLMTGKFCQFK